MKTIRVVLRIGGSIIERGSAESWLGRAIGHAGTRSILIVCGGGSLANAVRHQQGRLRYPDAVAHRMAILAMQQNAWLVQDIAIRLLAGRDDESSIDASFATSDGSTIGVVPHVAANKTRQTRNRLVPIAETRTHCLTMLSRPGIAVWLPDRMTATAAELPQNWQVSSDSIATWLATNVRADELVIAKSTTGGVFSNNPQALLDNDIVDAAFPDFAERFTGRLLVTDDPLAW